ncbi:MAG: SHOCT domain-containing protein [Bacteroidales bacterium]
MGLFSNKDKGCPICGGATPRLLAKKFEGQPICSKCANQILTDNEKVKSWTMEELQKHLQARAQNKAMVDGFTPTRIVEYDHEAVIDDTKQLFYIKEWTVDNPPVFRFEDISGFNIELGFHTVESWSRGMTRVPFQPVQLGVMGGVAALAEAFSDKEKDSEYETLKVTLKVNTPYLHEYELCNLSVSGEGRVAFANDIALEMAKVNIICNLIVSLTEGTLVGDDRQSPATDPADDIVKYKNLLDSGIITQEEFDQKKKQLLGI